MHIQGLNGCFTSKMSGKIKQPWEKIYNSLFQAKTYWSILKTFNNEKKIH